jgi:hypothetical protein
VYKFAVKKSMTTILLPAPSFFSHEQEDSRKFIDPEERVSEPLECGHDSMLWGSLVDTKNRG